MLPPASTRSLAASLHEAEAAEEGLPRGEDVRLHPAAEQLRAALDAIEDHLTTGRPGRYTRSSSFLALALDDLRGRRSPLANTLRDLTRLDGAVGVRARDGRDRSRHDVAGAPVLRVAARRLPELTPRVQRVAAARVLDLPMTVRSEPSHPSDEPRVVSATREIAASPDSIFALIADPAEQPRWDGNDNLARAEAGQRVHAVGEVFVMTLTTGKARENHVVEFEEGRRIAWTPAEPGKRPPGHLWRWELEPVDAARTRVTHTYDWTRLTDSNRLPRARATTSERLAASIVRLAALAESR